MAFASIAGFYARSYVNRATDGRGSRLSALLNPRTTTHQETCLTNKRIKEVIDNIHHSVRLLLACD